MKAPSSAYYSYPSSSSIGGGGYGSGGRAPSADGHNSGAYRGGASASGIVSSPPSAPTAAPRSRWSPAEQFRLLEVELDRTKRHLAEVIDEVVFAEKCKADAESRLASHLTETEAIELILQDMIGYIIAIESSVIVPALDDVTEAIPTGTVAERARLFSDLETLRHVSPRTIRLIASMKNPTESRRERFRQRREQLLRQGSAAASSSSASARPPVSLDDAYALCALLLDAKEELQLLLGESRDRARGIAGGSAATTALLGSAAAGSGSASRFQHNQSNGHGAATSMIQQQPQPQQPDPATQQLLDTLKAQSDAVRLELDAARKEKEMLNARLNELSASAALPYEQLQQQHYKEKERLQREVRALQASEKASAEKYQYATGKLEVLSDTVAQLQEEKRLLAADLKGYRRNEAALADGERVATLQLQHKQSADDAHRLRLALEAATRDHSATVARLEAQNSHLRLELTEAKQIGRPANNEHFAQLQRTNDLLRKDLVVLQQRMLSSAGRVTDSSAAFDAKVVAFEATITALNNELASLEAKIHSQEDAFAAERAAMLDDVARERARHQADKEDYDSLMQRMVDEMEKIVAENKALKERIQAVIH